MDSYNYPTRPPPEAPRQILRLPGDQEVTLTFAGTSNTAIKTAKDILIQHSIKKLINKGYI
jgi:hypothetical protein